jgi:hypothetical protein
MPASYTSSLKLTLPADGDTNWGSLVNTGITTLVDEAVAGTSSIVLPAGTTDRTLTSGDGSAPNEARKMFLNVTGTPSGATNIICPAVSKLYFVSNNTTGGFAITLKTASGTGIAVANGKKSVLYCNGTNVIDAITSSIAGSDTQVQYNNAGAAGASANLTFDGTSLTVNGVTIGRGLGNQSANMAVGPNALESYAGSISGNMAIGPQALQKNTTGYNNTGVGYISGWKLTSGANNVALGGFTLYSATTGTSNTALGLGALQNLTSGTDNIGIGNGAAYTTGTGTYNISIGNGSYNVATSGTRNISIGHNSALQVTGNNNVCIGTFTGNSSGCSGSNLVLLGDAATPSSTTISNEVTIGNSSTNTFRYYGTLTSVSDARDKTNIQPLVPGLNFINRLSPVSFDWNMRDGGRVGIADTGFIAQDLKACQSLTQEFIPGLVYESNPDQLEASYGKLIPVLVKAIQELTARVAELEGK